MMHDPRRKMLDEARKRCESRVHQCGCTPYIRTEGGVVTEVGCRVCDRPVSALREVGKPIETTRSADGSKIVTRRVTLQRLPNRRGILIRFDDGSAHETEVCADCIASLTADQLEAIYCRDLHQFAVDEDTDGVECPWHALADRKPTGFERLD